jgi:hypothetical protein
MTTEETIRAVLLSDASINAVVAGRIYPGQLPQAPLTPSITFFRPSGDHLVNQDGATSGRIRMQFDLWATTYDLAAALRTKVLAALNGYSGPGLQGVFSELDGGDNYDDATKLHSASLDFMVYES